MKKFIITIDTEGDNLWEWKTGDAVNTENAAYVARFQKVCEAYAFPPVYLTNYEMLQDDSFVKQLRDWSAAGTCEIGMHLHAWNMPPEYTLPIRSDCKPGAPYLIEYPYEIMEEKIKIMTDLIREKTGVQPVSHRAGRWAMNNEYFELLAKYGYKLDCSVVPGVDFSKTCPGCSPDFCGPNYSDYPHSPYKIETKEGTVYEYPVSIVRSKAFISPDKMSAKGLLRMAKSAFCGKTLWLRPNGNNTNAMKYLLKQVAASNESYVMFMLHSSEMMSGGSPTFQTNESIERLYRQLEIIFSYARELGFEGSTLASMIENQTL